MWQKLRDNFVAGIAVILPLIVTIWLLDILYRWVSGRLIKPLTAIFTPYLTNPYLEHTVSVAIFILLILIIIAIGMATRIIFLRKIFSSGERVFFKIPMIGKVYVAMKQISQAFLGKNGGAFKSVVLVEYPRKGIYSIGFLTGENKGEVEDRTGKKLFNVYIASVPNPTTGYFVLVPAEEIIELKMSVEDAMKLAISGGAVMPHSAQLSND